MKLITTALTLLCLSIGVASAGDYYTKQPVAPAPPVVVPPDCPCFDPGVELSLFGAGTFPDDGDDRAGGGIGLGFFFSENLGVNFSYHAFDTEPSVHHVGTADLVLRFPIHDLCIAPYVFGGGGVITNGETDGLFRAGGGIDIRLDQVSCVGFFIDGAYNWIEDSDSSHEDDVIVRAGFKIPF